MTNTLVPDSTARGRPFSNTENLLRGHKYPYIAPSFEANLNEPIGKLSASRDNAIVPTGEFKDAENGMPRQVLITYSDQLQAA